MVLRGSRNVLCFEFGHPAETARIFDNINTTNTFNSCFDNGYEFQNI